MILACAWLASQKWTQENISLRLAISQATVSRYIREARSQNLLVERLEWPADVDVAKQQAIMNTGYGQQETLLKQLESRSREGGGVGIASLVVVDIAPNADDPMKDFARACAPLVARWIDQPSVHTCAAAWGRTLGEIARSMLRQGPKDPSPAAPSKTFIPVAGEPLNHPDHVLSPSRVVRDLCEAMGYPKSSRLSLQGVPARIPKSLDGADAHTDAEVIRRFVARSDAYRRIFLGDQSDPALIGQAEMLLVGVGTGRTARNPDDGQVDPWYEEITQVEQDADHPTEKDVGTLLETISVGNLAGWWIRRPDATADQNARIDQINSRSLGLQINHIDDCAQRCARGAGKTPGVICLAMEPTKSDVLWQALGHINRLVISSSLADELLQRT